MPTTGGFRRGAGGHGAGASGQRFGRIAPHPPQPKSPANRAGRPAVAPGPAQPALAAKILIAGVDRDERRPIEAAVCRALPQRADGQWMVSLVRLGSQWSITLEGPGVQQRSFAAGADGLEAAIRAAVGSAVGREGSEPPATDDPLGSHAAHAEARVEHECKACLRRFAVVYEARPQEPKVLAAVACPHCWQIDRVEIGEWAASGRDYRAVEL